MASTITRDTWTNDSGSAASPNLDGTIINNAVLQNNIYARVDQMFAGAAPYNPLVFGGAIQSDGQPRCSAWNSVVQTIATATLTALTLDSEDFDVGSMHSTSSNTSRLTIPSGMGGLYLMSGQTSFGTTVNAVGYRQLLIKKNGTTYIATSVMSPIADASTSTGTNIVNIAVLSASDYVELIATQTSGGNVDMGAGGGSRYGGTIFQIVRLW